jgi:hypothetical protein
MKNHHKTICAALALTFALGTSVPLSAAPIVPMAPQAESGIINAQYDRRDRYEMRRELRRDRFWRQQARRDRQFDRREARQEARFERRADRRFYRGYRGYRYYRPGYRERDGYWFPAAAFLAGAIITGAISNSGGGGGHVAWCENRWRSYRAYDNTYQPSYGPRRVCVSPYD